ncbi:hypothetical protein M0R45_016068 [Rubus argutus]|uniref:Protein kinase domain-containing protein n=1 Tax=Rubus argutus TaxID=59490 RepID=A0AAW1XSU5_RUBAR
MRPSRLPMGSGLYKSPNLSEQDGWKEKKRHINIIAPVVGSILIILLTIVAVLWGFERKRQHELVKITNNFATIIGSGGFGKVYHGTLKDGIQVAVKLLTSSSSGSKEFKMSKTVDESSS